MLAGKDEYLQEASETIYRMSADELVRKRCRDREEYYQDLRSYERAIEAKERMIEKYKRDKEEHEQDLRNYEHTIQEKDAQIQQLQAEIEQLKLQNDNKLLL